MGRSHQPHGSVPRMEPDASTMEVMRSAATQRAAMWRLCTEIASRPTEDFVERLRDGRVGDEIRHHTAWLADASPFDDLLRTLQAFVNRSSRFSFDDDLASLQGEWERLELGKDVPRVTKQLAEMADREAEAWGRGDHEDAKEQRLRQFEDMEMRLEPLARWCQRADDETRVLITQVLVRVFAAQTTVESGRDLLGSLERTGGSTATFAFD